MKTAEEIGRTILAVLAAQAARNKNAAISLRAEICDVLIKHQLSKRLSARKVLTLLTRDPAPKLRTVHKHLKILRAQSSVMRD
jgi:hypothetical protein